MYNHLDILCIWNVVYYHAFEYINMSAIIINWRKVGFKLHRNHIKRTVIWKAWYVNQSPYTFPTISNDLNTCMMHEWVLYRRLKLHSSFLYSVTTLHGKSTELHPPNPGWFSKFPKKLCQLFISRVLYDETSFMKHCALIFCSSWVYCTQRFSIASTSWEKYDKI